MVELLQQRIQVRNVVNKVSTNNATKVIAKELKGTASQLKNGYKIEIPNGNRPIVVSMMNECSGGRTNPYFRVSINGKGLLTFDGKLPNDRGLTPIDLTDDYLNQINNMITIFLRK